MRNTSKVVFICSLSAAAGAQAQPYYRVTDLGAIGTNESWATAVNASGAAAGTSIRNDASRLTSAVRFSGGAVTDLGRFSGGNWAWGWAINDAGQIAGISQRSGTFNAFRWSGGTLTLLNSLAANLPTAAFGINATGVVVGAASPPGANINGRNAVRWNGTVITNLGTLGGFNSYAYAINNVNDIVGASDTTAGPIHACLWRGIQKIDLGTLGGRGSEARDVNNAAQIVGWAHNAEGVGRAFLWENGAMSDLGSLGTSSEARAITDAGWVVGTSWVVGEGQRAFVRASTGTMVNLNSRVAALNGWTLQYAMDMNSTGVIVGYGRVNGKSKAFKLTPGVCSVDFDADGFVSGEDFDAFVAAFESGAAPADFDLDGFVSGIDFDLFAQAYEAGC